MKIRKHRIWPLIILAIFVTFLTTLLGTEYIAAVTIDNYRKENKEFNKSFENVALLVEHEIANYQDFLCAVSTVISQTCKENPNADVNKILQLVAKANQFDELHILVGDQIPSGAYDGWFTQSGENLCFYSAITMPDTTDYLCGSISLTKVSYYLHDLIKDDVVDLLLLNQNKEVLLTLNSTEFDYNAIQMDSFYDENSTFSSLIDNIQYIFDLDDNENQEENTNSEETTTKKHSMYGFFQSFKNFINVTESDDYLWFELPVTIDCKDYTIITAKVATFSEETIISCVQASIIVGFIILLCFFIWLFFIIFQGVTNRRLYKAAFIDPLTKYNNGTKFRIETNKFIKRRKHPHYVLILFDIDNFKIINDLYGYDYGNKVLINVSDAIRQQVRKHETGARFTNDEFMMLIAYEDESLIQSRLLEINQQILANVALPTFKMSYGVYVIHDYTLSVEQMTIYAGMAKDTIKGLKEEFIGYFDEAIRRSMLRDKELENASEVAFANKEFVVYLQPKYNALTNKMGGAEALVRWISPIHGFISPGDFIPLFEKNHMIVHLDNYMLEEVCRLQRTWLDEGKELVTISVNISRVHLTTNHLLEEVLEIVDRYQIPHKYIELELTESAFFDGKEKLLNVVSSLQEHGFLVSMDDFGSGYSSLNSLKDLPLDVIKLDGEFFRTTANIERSETVIRDTINLAKHLQMKIVAEGVETKEQVDFLNGIGCDLIQGFYFAKPMPVNEFEQRCYSNDSTSNNVEGTVTIPPTSSYDNAASMVAATKEIDNNSHDGTTKPVETAVPVLGTKPLETAQPVVAIKPIEIAKPVDVTKPNELKKE